jgi:hypothetical protein
MKFSLFFVEFLDRIFLPFNYVDVVCTLLKCRQLLEVNIHKQRWKNDSENYSRKAWVNEDDDDDEGIKGEERQI